MNQRDFIIKLALFSIGPATIILLFYLIRDLRMHQAFSWACLIAFLLFSYLMYFLAASAAAKPNKGAFISLTMLFNGLKILLSLALVMGYYLVYHPENKLFLIPFFIIYLLYTIFEIYFLSKIAKSG